MIGWIDLETTGLDPKRHSLLEVVLIVTDDALNVLRSKHVLIVPPAALEWDRDFRDLEVMHTENGLFQEALERGLSLSCAEDALCATLGVKRDARDNGMPMGGASTWFDRIYLQQYMPTFEKMFHYRNFDVSAVREMTRRWNPSLHVREPPSRLKHRAEPDLHDTIDIARFYRRELFGVSE